MHLVIGFLNFFEVWRPLKWNEYLSIDAIPGRESKVVNVCKGREREREKTISLSRNVY